MREGLAAVISVKLRDPQFEGQTKTKLGNPWVRGLVEQTVNAKLAEFLEENPTDARQIVQKAIAASQRAPGGAQGARADAAEERARELLAARASSPTATIRDPEDAELYLVEGDSAGGSAIDGPRPHLPGDPAAARQDHQLARRTASTRCSRTTRSRR